jgi:hypothetical protein
MPVCRTGRVQSFGPVATRRKYGRRSYCQPCFNERSKKSHAKRVKEKHGREVRESLIVPDGQRHCPDCNEIKLLEESRTTAALGNII